MNDLQEMKPEMRAAVRDTAGGLGRRQLQLSPNRYHRLLQVIGRLDANAGTDPFESARGVVVDWLRRRKRWSISDEQAGGTPPVEIEVEDSTQALFIESAPGLWAVRLNDPCSQIPGRQWRVELVLVEMDDGQGPVFGCTLSVLVPSGADEVLRSPGRPAVVGMLAQSHGLSDGGFRLDGTVWEVDRPSDVDRLVAFIESTARKIPVVAVSESRQGEMFVNAAQLAKGLAGLGIVVRLTADAAQELTERYGRTLGVFGNAVRMYRVGFDADVDTWRRHPLYTAGQWHRRVHALERNLQFDAMEDSVSTRDENRDLPSFSVIRRIASEQRIHALARGQEAGVDTSLLELEVARLHRQTEAWEKMAYDEEENARRALHAQNQTKARLQQSTARIEALEAQLRALGGQTREPNPASFDDLGEWAARNLSGSLIVTPKAERAAQRSTFEDIPHVYDCLYFLGTRYRDMKRGLVTRDAFDGELATLGIRVTPTGRAVETARFEGEYGVVWEGHRYKLNMHLAGSGSHDPRFGLRIYFTWDDEQQLVVVGHLPGHLTNSLT